MLFRRKRERVDLVVCLSDIGNLVVEVDYSDRSTIWLVRIRLFHGMTPAGIDIGDVLETIPGYLRHMWLSSEHAYLISIGSTPTLQNIMGVIQHVTSRFELTCSQVTWQKFYAREP